MKKNLLLAAFLISASSLTFAETDQQFCERVWGGPANDPKVIAARQGCVKNQIAIRASQATPAANPVNVSNGVTRADVLRFLNETRNQLDPKERLQKAYALANRISDPHDREDLKGSIQRDYDNLNGGQERARHAAWVQECDRQLLQLRKLKDQLEDAEYDARRKTHPGIAWIGELGRDNALYYFRQARDKFQAECAR